MQYTPPWGASDPNASFVNGNPAIGLPGSIVPAGAVEYPQREIINAVIAARLVPTSSDLDQLTEAIKLLGRIPFAVDGGSANHIVVNPTPAISAYSAPLIMAVQVSFANTGSTGVNVSGLGEIPLIRTTGAPMAPNDLPQSGLILIGLTGTSFQLLSVPGSLAFPAAQQLNHYGVDISSSANTIIATIDYVGASLPVGVPIMVKVANANTGATVAIINGFSSVPVTRGAGLSLTAGDTAAGYIALMVFDGAELQLINFLQGAAGASGGNDITGPDNLYLARGPERHRFIAAGKSYPRRHLSHPCRRVWLMDRTRRPHLSVQRLRMGDADHWREVHRRRRRYRPLLSKYRRQRVGGDSDAQRGAAVFLRPTIRMDF